MLVNFSNDIVIVCINEDGIVSIGLMVGIVFGDGEIIVSLLFGESGIIIFFFEGSGGVNI